MPTPKVFLEAHNMSNMNSGFGQFNYWLIKNLVQENKNFEFVVNAKSRINIKDFAEDVSFHKYYNITRHKLFRPRTKYSLWHSLNQNSKIEPFSKLPYLLTVHDVTFMVFGSANKKQIEYFKRKIARADTIVYVSNYSKDSTNKYFEIPNSKPQHIVYNGNPVIPRAIFTLPRHIPAQERPFLFSIGQFLPMKNFHSLIGMLSLLKDYNLILAGNNEKSYAEVVRKEIDKFNLKNRVFLIGKITEDEKHYYLQNCKAFVYPSLYEGFGLPPIEAMAYGKPVFLAQRTSLPEIGGKYAFYWEDFDPQNMCEVFYKGMNMYENNIKLFQRKLKNRGNSFSWNNCAKDYLRIYSNVLNKY